MCPEPEREAIEAVISSSSKSVTVTGVQVYSLPCEVGAQRKAPIRTAGSLAERGTDLFDYRRTDVIQTQNGARTRAVAVIAILRANAVDFWTEKT
jgi:hypothetical protein